MNLILDGIYENEPGFGVFCGAVVVLVSFVEPLLFWSLLWRQLPLRVVCLVRAMLFYNLYLIAKVIFC